MPQQVPRLLVVFVLLGGGLFTAWRFLIPETFGELGHYRAAAIDSIMAADIKYAGHDVCAGCHPDLETQRSAGFHSGVSCESCHGPAAQHANGPMDIKPSISRDREACVLCHAFNPSRPTGFPQIDPTAHNAPTVCVTCHDPHAPEPPVTPEDCSACHGQIARQKSVSHHAMLPCSTCHVAPEEHKVSPRAVRPTRPLERAFCESCHAEAALGDTGVPQVDPGSHGDDFLCWQCHYPHYPEIGG